MGIDSFSIKGLERSSFVDWDGRVSAVLFTGGCNFRCPFCHNAGLALAPGRIPDLPAEAIEVFLEDRIGWLDIVITGGEPTVHPRLAELCRYIKDLGYMIKLDTNGYRPDVIESLARAGLIDYAAMDIKSSLEDYARAVGVPDLDLSRIQASVEFLLSGDLDFEFRSTVAGDFFTEEKALAVAEWIAGAPRYRLQPFEAKPDAPVIDPDSVERLSLIPVPLVVLAEIFKRTIPDVRIRGQAEPLPENPLSQQ